VKRRFVIAVDGPSASGKGTAARGVAMALGYTYVDTGALYRAVALVAKRRGVPWDDAARVSDLARSLRLVFDWDEGALRLQADGDDVTRDIRTDDIGQGASLVSRYAGVRDALLDLQRGLAANGGIVMDGRDIGTVVLPGADLKVYLDATLDERVRRRHEELLRRGETVSVAEVRDALLNRDRQDTERAIAPLRVSPDAVLVDTTDLTVRQAVDALLALVRAIDTKKGNR